MTHRTALATIRTLARQAGSTAGRIVTQAAGTAAREVRTRIAERSAAPVGVAPPDSSAPAGAPRAPAAASVAAPAEPASPAGPPARRTPSPADVARTVARNATGLVRATPAPARPTTPRRSAPGAKLPVRSARAS